VAVINRIGEISSDVCDVSSYTIISVLVLTFYATRKQEYLLEGN
jgi:hypothetical protein